MRVGLGGTGVPVGGTGSEVGSDDFGVAVGTTVVLARTEAWPDGVVGPTWAVLVIPIAPSPAGSEVTGAAEVGSRVAAATASGPDVEVGIAVIVADGSEVEPGVSVGLIMRSLPTPLRLLPLPARPCPVLPAGVPLRPVPSIAAVTTRMTTATPAAINQRRLILVNKGCFDLYRGVCILT